MTTDSKTEYARLPSFKLLQSQYLHGQPDQVKHTIGGELDSDQYVDTCAMRMSWTLNHVNIPIPPPHHSSMYVLQGTDIDGHKSWYALRHKEIREWLKHILGPPQISEKGHPINMEHFALYNGKPAKGIIVLDVQYQRGSTATGHIDLWDGQNFTEDSERGVEEATFQAASRADLWIAPD